MYIICIYIWTNDKMQYPIKKQNLIWRFQDPSLLTVLSIWQNTYIYIYLYLYTYMHMNKYIYIVEYLNLRQYINIVIGPSYCELFNQISTFLVLSATQRSSLSAKGPHLLSLPSMTKPKRQPCRWSLNRDYDFGRSPFNSGNYRFAGISCTKNKNMNSITTTKYSLNKI